MLVANRPRVGKGYDRTCEAPSSATKRSGLARRRGRCCADLVALSQSLSIGAKRSLFGVERQVAACKSMVSGEALLPASANGGRQLVQSDAIDFGRSNAFSNLLATFVFVCWRQVSRESFREVVRTWEVHMCAQPRFVIARRTALAYLDRCASGNRSPCLVPCMDQHTTSKTGH